MQYKFRSKLLDEFSCLGSDCPDTCCQQWNIDIDDSVVHKWKTELDTDLTQKLMDSVRYVNHKNKAVALFKTTEENYCVHLNQDKLCSLHADYGEGVLPKVCREYPRFFINGTKFYLQSLSLSCPEVVRLLFANTVKSELFEDETTYNENYPGEVNYPALSNKLEQIVAWVLMAENIAVTTKIYYLCTMIDPYVTVNGESDFSRIDIGGLNNINEAALINNLHSIGKRTPKLIAKVNKLDSGGFWNAVLFVLKRRLKYIRQPYKEQDGLISQLLQLSHDPREQDKKACLKLYAFISENAHLLKKYKTLIDDALSLYLRYSFRHTGFCCSPIYDNFGHAFVDPMVRYVAIKLILLAVVVDKGMINKDDLLNVVYQVDRALTHNSDAVSLYKMCPDSVAPEKICRSLLLL